MESINSSRYLQLSGDTRESRIRINVAGEQPIHLVPLCMQIGWEKEKDGHTDI